MPAPPLSVYKPEDWPDLLSTAQVAQLLSVDRTTILGLLERGELRGVRVGKPWRIAAEEVWAYVPQPIRAHWPAGPWRDPSPRDTEGQPG